MLGSVLALLAAVAVAPGVSVPVEYWFAPATEKVHPDTPRPQQPHPGRLCAALGEYEAIQLVLRAEQDVPRLRVAVLPWSPTRRLAPNCIELFEVKYVPTPADRRHACFPDPLVPLALDGQVACVDLKAGETKAVWVRLRVPEDASPGAYKLRVVVGAFGLVGGLVQETNGPFIMAPLHVTLWPFRLPRGTHARTAFGISGSYIAQQHGVKTGTPEYDELYRRYYDELLEHRVCAYSLPYGLMDSRAVPYLRDERVNAFTVSYTDEEDRMREEWSYLRALGVAHKAWIYPLDEPVNRDQYTTLKRRAAHVHTLSPGLKVCSPFFRGPDWDDKLTPFDELVGYLDIWCCNTGYYSKPEIQQLMRERQKKGEEAWWYVCCGPGHPFCNFFVNMAALQHRLLMWQMYRYDITGLLYWSTTYWNPASTKDPWEDIATVKDINPSIYGDGSLFYPGARYGIKGPVTSVRLECIRDGLEDYEYLVLARRVLDQQTVDVIVHQIAPELVRYETDPTKFEDVRRMLGEMLTAAKG